MNDTISHTFTIIITKYMYSALNLIGHTAYTADTKNMSLDNHIFQLVRSVVIVFTDPHLSG